MLKELQKLVQEKVPPYQRDALHDRAEGIVATGMNN